MGFDPVTIAIGATILSTGLQVASGFMQYSQQKKADKAARNAANSEAALMEEDAKRAALQERMDADKHRDLQKSLFLKSGVDLVGSPLLVMEETRNKGDENAKNITDSAKARADLVRQQGSVGRASLLSTVAEAGSTIASGVSSGTLLKKQLS